MSGICDKCKRKPCPAEGEGLRYCDFYEGGESNYEKLFGTPERAARTWIDYCGGFMRCADCPCCHDEHGFTCELPPEVCAWVDEKRGYDALLEWLREVAK